MGRTLKRRTTPEEVVKRAKRSLKKKKKEEEIDYISTGSFCLNLASSQKGRDGGLPRGRIIRIVGDGSSGKTLLALEICAQAVYNLIGTIQKVFPRVKKVVIVYNNTELVMDFPLKKMYGQKFIDTVEFIRIPSVEGTGRDIGRRLRKIKPGTYFLYIIDSWDIIKAEKELQLFESSLNKNEEKSDGYGQTKPKYATQKFLPNISRLMEGKDANIIFIAQTRDVIGQSFGPRKRVGGGGGFNFYTHQELWLREVRKLVKTIQGHKITYGVDIEGLFKRNKTSLPFRSAPFTVRFDYGIDDIDGMLAWYFGPEKAEKKLKWKDIKLLRLSKRIKKKKDKKDKIYKKQTLIKFIEKNDLEDELKEAVELKWKLIEDGGATKGRKARFV